LHYAVTDSSTISGNPLLDEDSFQKLLAAAYVLQEHQDRQRTAEATKPESAAAGAPPSHPYSAPLPATSDYSQTLAQIVATQEQIQRAQLALPEAMNMIAEQTQFITRASGTVIGLREGDDLLYSAVSGSARGLLGSRVAVNKCLSAKCLDHDAILYCPEVDTDSRIDAQLCQQRGIKGLIAVPIHREGGSVAGSIEVYFAAANSFEEHDVRTCQLMAGMVGEAMARAAELDWKQALAEERATMLGALEKLKPQLERLANEPLSTSPNRASPGSTLATPVPNLAITCPECGSQLDPEQLFCGQCGSERPAPKKAETQSPWASIWHPDQPASREAVKVTGVEAGDEPFKIDARILDVMPESTVVPEALIPDSAAPAADSQAPSQPASSWLAQVRSHPWSSADKAKAWLESQIGTGRAGALKHLLKGRRADVYLLVAIILVVVAVAWAIWSHQGSPLAVGTPPTATTASTAMPGTVRRRKPTEPKLTLNEKLLIWLGLAEPPPAPVYSGNPATQVWVDMRTALYYCPGADLYGKTEKGKFTTQRDAQMDQFEPAYRRACD
jgi:GAF domain-containing protein